MRFAATFDANGVRKGAAEYEIRFRRNGKDVSFPT